MKVYRTEGIILKRNNTGEADKVITVFTKQFGKKRYLAKGVRKVTSRRSPQLELFNTTSFLIHRSSYYEVISETASITPFPSDTVSLDQIKQAYECCEIIDLLTRENQPHDDVYDLLYNALTAIRTQTTYDMVHFKIATLTELGFYAPDRIEDQGIDQMIEEIAERRLRARTSYE